MDPKSPELRVEMWPHWLHESVDGAVTVLDVLDVKHKVALSDRDERLHCSS